MKIDWSHITGRRGLIIISLVMCLVVIGSANYIYTKSQNDKPNIPSINETSPSPSHNEKVDASSDPGANKGEGGDTNVGAPATTPTASPSIVPSPSPTPDVNTGAQTEYFDAYRLNRQNIRDMEMRYVQTIAQNENSDAEIRAEAERRLLQITEIMEKELKIENLIKSKGFADAIAFVEEGSVNIVVKAEKLSTSDAAKILKIVTDETKEAAQNITIITRL